MRESMLQSVFFSESMRLEGQERGTRGVQREPDGEEMEETVDQEDWDGVDIFMWMAEMIPRVEPQHCLDVVRSRILLGLNSEHKDEFHMLVDTILGGNCKRGPATVPVDYLERAACFSHPSTILANMKTIMMRRRAVQPDDWKKTSERERAKLFNDWFNEFARNPSGLEATVSTGEEKKETMSSMKERDAFRAFLKNNFGGKHWITAVWQEGLPWIPAHVRFQSASFSCASEQRVPSFVLISRTAMINAFCVWLAKVLVACVQFQEEDNMHRSKQTSRDIKKKSGLTRKYLKSRDRYVWLLNQRVKAQLIHGELKAYDAWTVCKIYPTSKRFEEREPRSLEEMRSWEHAVYRWWLCGDLNKQIKKEERKRRSRGL